MVEGKRRLRFDEREYQRSIAEDPIDVIGYSSDEQARLEKTVDEEIRSGRVEPGSRNDRIRELKRSESREIMEFIARERATKEHKSRGEEEVIRSLLALDTSRRHHKPLGTILKTKRSSSNWPHCGCREDAERMSQKPCAPSLTLFVIGA